MSESTDVLTPGQIAVLAGVDSSTVSNWRRRHPDFPPPVGGSQRRPLFDRGAVVSWLSANGKSTEVAPRQAAPDPSYASSAASHLAVAGATVAWQIGLASEVPSSGPLSALVVPEGTMSPTDASNPRALSAYLRSLSRAEGLGPELREAMVDAADCVSQLDAGLAGALFELNTGAGKNASVATIPLALSTLDQTRDRVSDELGTHVGLAHFGNSILDPEDVASVVDIAAGRGDFLAIAARMYPHATLTAIEPDGQLASALRLRLALLGRHVEIFRIPVPRAALPAGQFDIVFCDPPLGSAELWAPEDLATLRFGPPPLNQQSLAWVEFAVPLISKRGTGLVITESEVLGEIRHGEDAVRRELIESSAVSAILALPRGLRSSSPAPLAMWILESPDDDRSPYVRRSVLMLNAGASARGDLVGDGFAKMYRQFTEREDEEYGVEYSPQESNERSDTVSRSDLAVPGVVIEPAFWIAPHRGTETWRSDPLDSYYMDLGTASDVLDSPLVVRRAVVRGRQLPRITTIGELVDAGLLSLLRGAATARKEDPRFWSENPRVVTSDVLFSARDYSLNGATFASGPDAVEADLPELGARDVVLGRANTGYLAVPFASDERWVLGKGMQALRVTDALDPRYIAESICSRWNDRHEALFDPTARSDIRRYEIALLPLDEQRRSMDHLYDLRQSRGRIKDIATWLEIADDELRDVLTSGDGVAAESTPLLRITRMKGGTK